MNTSLPLREPRLRLVRPRFIWKYFELIIIFRQSKSKIFLLCWCPDSAAIKKKMLYSSSFDTLKRAFVGVHKVNFPPNLGQGSVIKTFVIRWSRPTDTTTSRCPRLRGFWEPRTGTEYYVCPLFVTWLGNRNTRGNKISKKMFFISTLGSDTKIIKICQI